MFVTDGGKPNNKLQSSKEVSFFPFFLIKPMGSTAAWLFLILTNTFFKVAIFFVTLFVLLPFLFHSYLECRCHTVQKLKKYILIVCQLNDAAQISQHRCSHPARMWAEVTNRCREVNSHLSSRFPWKTQSHELWILPASCIWRKNKKIKTSVAGFQLKNPNRLRVKIKFIYLHF